MFVLLLLGIFGGFGMANPTEKLSSSPFFAKYGIRYQPELDKVTIDPYIKNMRLFNLQINCLVYDGPCDVGNDDRFKNAWLKINILFGYRKKYIQENVKHENDLILCTVGRWVYPRIGPYLLGQGCLKCTKNQEHEVERLLTWITDNKPEVLKDAIAKFVTLAGVELPNDSPLKHLDRNVDIPAVEDSPDVIWSEDMFVTTSMTILQSERTEFPKNK